MLQAIKKNRVLDIPQEKMDEYIALGYDIREDGQIIHKHEAPEEEVVELKAKVAELEAENAELKAKLYEKEKQAPEEKAATKAKK